MDELFFSASDLIKCSAKKICYMRGRPRPITTKRQNDGNKWAESMIMGFPEMRGIYRAKYGTIFYSFDEIRPYKDCLKLIEYKSVEDINKIEDWYLSNSILQMAFYTSLLMLNNDKILSTASFYLKNGNPFNKIDARYTKRVLSFLNMGGVKFQVNVIEPYRIVGLFLMKASMSVNYTKATAYDAEYKFKEYDRLKKCFEFKIL